MDSRTLSFEDKYEIIKGDHNKIHKITELRKGDWPNLYEIDLCT